MKNLERFGFLVCGLLIGAAFIMPGGKTLGLVMVVGTISLIWLKVKHDNTVR